MDEKENLIRELVAIHNIQENPDFEDEVREMMAKIKEEKNLEDRYKKNTLPKIVKREETCSAKERKKIKFTLLL